MRLNGAQAIVQCLREARVECVFGLSAEPVLPIMDIIDRTPGMRFVPVRCERNAGFMANGYSRASGRIGVCLVLAGPGSLNLIPSVANASVDSYPMLVIAGESPIAAIGRDTIHGDVDFVGSFGKVAKRSTRILSADIIPNVMRQMLREATTGSPSPGYLQIPSDLLKGEIEFEPASPDNYGLNVTRGFSSSRQIKEAVDLLVKAERPAILAGGGAVISNCSRELLQLAEILAIPIATTNQGKGAIPEDHPLSLGLSSSYAKEIFLKADVMLVAGSRLTSLTARLALPKQAKVIQIDIEPSRVGKNWPIEIGIVGDARTVLHEMVETAKMVITATLPVETLPVAKEIDRLKKEWEKRNESKSFSEQVPINPLRLMRDLRKALDRHTIVCVDTGQNQQWVGYFFPVYEPGTMIASNGYGPMGVAFPSAIGAKLAMPDRQVVCVTGDGGLMMAIHDLETAVRCKVPITTVIINDFAMGRIKVKEKLQYGRYFGVDHENPDFAKLAELFGAHGERVEEPSEIVSAVERSLNSGKPALIDVIIDPKEVCDFGNLLLLEQ